MDGLSNIICKIESGCTMGGRMINHLIYAYADDLVMLIPSAKGFQRHGGHNYVLYGDIH